MKANELRIGNYVFEENGIATIIIGIDDSTRVSTEAGFFPYTPIDKVNPIPLTEEWLVKFGFRNVSIDEIHAYQKGDIQIVLGTKTCVFKHKFVRFTFYVHQLQNLYFALTNEELKISNEPSTNN